MPDGSAYNIRFGITTMAYRNDRFGNRQTYLPYDIVGLHIETLPVTWQINAGNRLRIDVTSSNSPEYGIHSNYPGIWSEQTRTREALQTIYRGGEYPSSISFPITDLH